MELKPKEKDWSWALDWLRGKGFTEDEVAEFGRGLREHDVYRVDHDHRREQDQPAPFPGRPTRGGEPLPLTGDSASKLDRMLMQPDPTRASIARLDKLLREPEKKARETMARLSQHLNRIRIV